MTPDIFDIAILSVILISAIVGFTRGFVREALSLATWIAAVIVAYVFYEKLKVELQQFAALAQLGKVILNIISFGLIFFLVLFVGGLLGGLIGKAISSIGLTSIDRVLGTAFGVLLGGFLLTLAVLVTNNFYQFNKETWWKESQLIPYFEKTSTTLKQFIEEMLKNHKKQQDSTQEKTVT